MLPQGMVRCVRMHMFPSMGSSSQIYPRHELEDGVAHGSALFASSLFGRFETRYTRWWQESKDSADPRLFLFCYYYRQHVA